MGQGVLNRAATLLVIGVVDFPVCGSEGGKVLASDGGDCTHGPEFSAVQKCFGGARLIPTVIDVGDVTGFAAGLMGGLELVNAIEVERQRFLEETVFSGFEYFDADGHMAGSGGADDDCGASRIGHGLLPVSRGLHLVFFGHVGENCRTGVAGDDVASTGFLEVAQVAFADAATTDDENGGEITHGDNRE